MNPKVIITMETQIIIRTTVFILLLVSCRCKADCVGVTSTHYEGNGQIFFHKPVSGSTYEFIYIPVCGMKPNGKLDLRTENLLPGVSFTCTSDSPLTREVLKAARRFSVNSYSNLAEQFQEIYICPIYIDIEGLVNAKVNSDQQSENNKKVMTIENRKVIITYFYSNFPKIKRFKILY